MGDNRLGNRWPRLPGIIQRIFSGIIGEYIGAIHTQVLKRPLVIAKEWINFDKSREVFFETNRL